MEEPKRKKLLGPLEWLMLLAGIGIIGYITFQKGGGNVMERSETIRILDKPNAPRQKARRYRDADREESVERLLQELADDFSSEDDNRPILRKQSMKSKLSKDEEKYYKKVRDRATLTDKIESTKDWYRLLRASHQTYTKVREIVGEVSRQPEDRVNANDVKSDMKSQVAQNDFYQKLGETFRIDPQDIEAFGRTGRRALSDWADFVEQNSEN